jgi:hypothetical protein
MKFLSQIQEEILNELSNQKLGNYAKAAAKNNSLRAYGIGKVDGNKVGTDLEKADRKSIAERGAKKFKKREAYINKAIDRVTK